MIKTSENTSYSIEKWTDNIIEITTVNGYVSSNTVHYTTWEENPQDILAKYNNLLKETDKHEKR